MQRQRLRGVHRADAHERRDQDAEGAANAVSAGAALQVDDAAAGDEGRRASPSMLKKRLAAALERGLGESRIRRR
jgi:hypothetical protein